MRVTFLAVCLLAIVVASQAKIYFQEEFNDKSWEDRWVKSGAKRDGMGFGPWKWTSGKHYDDAKRAKGIQTGADARFYGITSMFKETFDNKDKDLVLQFQVKHEQNLDCGGGYIKLIPAGTDQENFDGDSQYQVMFGPDICGTGTRRVHAIFHYEKKGENLLHNKSTRCETDELSHVYTFVVHPDNTYEIYIDGSKKESGSLFDDWDFLPPRKIQDPAASKPSDWVDDAEIPDPEDTKPSDWDDEPAKIADPDAEKPDDWDDEDDGEWEAPMIDNPEYKGEWKARMIPNPDYKGPWIHPEIDNPDFEDDPNVYHYNNIGGIAFDLWQVKSGSIFDNIIVTDNLEEADSFREATWGKEKDGEKDSWEEEQEEKRKAEEAARAEEDDFADDFEEDEWEDEEDEEDKAAARRAKLEALKEKARHDDDEDHDEL